MISEDTRDRILQFDWGPIQARLDRYAYSRMLMKGLRPTAEDANDVASDAIRSLFDFDKASTLWEPGEVSVEALHTELKRRVANSVSTLCKRKKARAQHTRRVPAQNPEWLATETNGEACDTQAELDLLETDLKAELAQDSDAVHLVECLFAGVLHADDQAEYLELPKKRIYRLKEKTQRALARVRPEGLDT